MNERRVGPGPALLIGTVLLLGACAAETPDQRLDRLATRFVDAAMHLDRLRPGEIDSWFGPKRLDTRGDASELDFAAIADIATKLREELAAETTERGQRLAQRAAELERAATFLANPGAASFAEQTESVYGIDWAEPADGEIDSALAAIDAALPGRGSVRARMASLRRRLLVPAELRQSVFETALAGCEQRTRAHWTLPVGERVEVIWSRDVDAAWHRYRGEGQSTLQVNPLAIATVDQAIDIACHESYPGHHAQFVLFEAAAADGGLPLEDRLVLLRSPASALREAAAMAAVDLAFPSEERLRFERDVLFPLAGLDPADAELLHQIRPSLKRLALAVPVIIREHEDRALSDAEAINRLQSEALVASPRALFAFAHEVGAYLAGYTMLNAELSARLDAASPTVAWAQLRTWLEDPDQWRETP